MWLADSDSIPSCVLSRYGPAFQELSWTAIPGGFSGAHVWRGDDTQGSPRVALKRWPKETTAERLAQIHAWMSEVANLEFVPGILPTLDGSTFAIAGEAIWDATSWLPGQPHTPAGKKEVEIACEAMARLHVIWAHAAKETTFFGLNRRIEVLRQWLSNPHTTIDGLQPGLTRLLQRALEVVKRTAPIVLQALLPWKNISVQVHPCFRDLRGEHVLFDAGRIAGIVDYGAMAIDSPALDLARLLGDLAGENDELFTLGLDKYRESCPKFDVSDRLVHLLDRAGVVCSLIGWFERLVSARASIPPEKTTNRLLYLVKRAQHLKSL